MQFSEKVKKYLKSLHQKKYRQEQRKFLVEGVKSILDFHRNGAKINSLYYTARTEPEIQDILFDKSIFTEAIKERDLEQISTQKTPSGVIALLDYFEVSIENLDIGSSPIVVLDGIKDPGNMGTIIRTCHWFGASMICINDCVDIYNPKVVQATMGSLYKVPVISLSMEEFQKLAEKSNLSVYGADLDGSNIRNIKMTSGCFIVLGSESNGISAEVKKLITQKIYIPEFDGRNKPESLNVAISAGIILSKLREN